MSPFVLISLDFWTAWETGELSDEERDLGFYLAFKTDFRTGLLVTTLDTIAVDLGWRVVRSTTGRRLERLVRLGFVEAQVKGRGNRRVHVLRPSNTLRPPSRLAQQSATSGATGGATSKPSSGAGSPDTSATSSATSRATVEGKGRSSKGPTAPLDPRDATSSVDGESYDSGGEGEGALDDLDLDAILKRVPA
jgi:hypothetical protein